jgi:hypothetical protein|tara:strand:- start:1369 stop:1671 length:303 start_codon:yes stop_codon:yes gene_type:complete
MEGIDIRLLVTVGGMAATVIAASAVVKASVKVLQDQAKDFEKRLRAVDVRIDKATTQIETLAQRQGVISSMMDPNTMERKSREIERLRTEMDFVQRKIKE